MKAIMQLFALPAVILWAILSETSTATHFDTFSQDTAATTSSVADDYKEACPDYVKYSVYPQSVYLQQLWTCRGTN